METVAEQKRKQELTVLTVLIKQDLQAPAETGTGTGAGTGTGTGTGAGTGTGTGTGTAVDTSESKEVQGSAEKRTQAKTRVQDSKAEESKTSVASVEVQTDEPHNEQDLAQSVNKITKDLEVTKQMTDNLNVVRGLIV